MRWARRCWGVELPEGVPRLRSLMSPRWGSVQVPEARLELTPRLGRGGELDTAPAGGGKRRSFSLTLVSLVASPLAAGTDGRWAQETDR